MEAEKRKSGISRRNLCLGVGGVAVLLGVGSLKVIDPGSVIRPPGGQDENQLLGACVRCERCIEACPRGVVKPAHLENGIVNVRTPTLSFSDNYCDWCAEENDGHPLCVQECPSGALQLTPADTPENVIIGKAAIDKDTCLAWRAVICRHCYDACPYEAMGLDEMNRPYVIEDKCNGCGACESVCVSLKDGSISAGATRRAIFVDPVEG